MMMITATYRAQGAKVTKYWVVNPPFTIITLDEPGQVLELQSLAAPGETDLIDAWLRCHVTGSELQVASNLLPGWILLFSLGPTGVPFKKGDQLRVIRKSPSNP
jgi:hypothetical protein